MLDEYSAASLVNQPIGYWSWAAHKAVVTHIRAELYRHGLSQPQWWVLSQLADAREAGEDGRTRAELMSLLRGYLDVGAQLEAEMDAVVAHGWATEDGAGRLHATAEGSALRAEAAVAQKAVRERVHAGISDEEYVRTLRVLQRMIDNVGGHAWHH